MGDISATEWPWCRHAHVPARPGTLVDPTARVGTGVGGSRSEMHHPGGPNPRWEDARPGLPTVSVGLLVLLLLVRTAWAVGLMPIRCR